MGPLPLSLFVGALDGLIWELSDSYRVSSPLRTLNPQSPKLLNHTALKDPKP